MAGVVSDVDAAVKAETSTRDAERRLQEFLDAGTDGFWEWDSRAGTLLHGARLRGMLGHDSVDSVLSAAEFFGRIHPEDRADAYRRYQSLLSGQVDSWSSEFRLSRADRSWVWVLNHGKVVERDPAGAPLRVVGTVKDITALKSTQDALAKSEERLRVAMGASTDGFWDHDFRTGLVFHNARLNELVGRPAVDEFVPIRTLESWTHPDDMPVVGPVYEDVLAGRKDRLDFRSRVRGQGGSWKWVRTRAKVIERGPDGRPLRMAGVVTDVDAAVRTEQALAAREAELRAVFEAPAVGVAITDGTQRLAQVNAHLCAMLGYTREELGEKKWTDITHPDDLEESMRGVAAMKDRRCDGFAQEKRYLRKDGTWLWCLTSASCTRYPDGEMRYIVAIIQDITARRRAVAQLQVSSRLAALGTLVAGVAHEVNNPLAGAMAGEGLAVEMLREVRARALQGERLEPEEVVRVLDVALEGLADAGAGMERIARIVKDLSTFGRSDVRRTRVRLVNAVEQALRWLVGSSTATIEVENAGAPDILGVDGQMSQVALNLVTNAIKAVPTGKQGVIKVRVGPGSPGTARLEVEDNGSGMTPDVMARVFDPFYTTRPAGLGTGLGLSVTHAIVTEHGGTIEVKSEVGKGSTFTVELPVAPAA